MENGLALNADKCIINAKELIWLGMRISSTGISPLTDKLTILTKVCKLSNKDSLKSFLETVNYYARFIKKIFRNCSSIILYISQKC